MVHVLIYELLRQTLYACTLSMSVESAKYLAVTNKYYFNQNTKTNIKLVWQKFCGLYSKN